MSTAPLSHAVTSPPQPATDTGPTVTGRRHQHALTVMAEIAAEHGLGVPDLIGRSLTHHVVAARQAAMLAVYTRCRMSSLEVGEVFDRDHTTVLSGMARARTRSRTRMVAEPPPERTPARHPHGNYLRYLDGCKCESCLAAWSARTQWCAMRRERGEQRYIDSTEVKAHVRELRRRYGVGLSPIMVAAGLSKTRGINRLIHRDHAARLLAIRIDDLPPATLVSTVRFADLVDDIRDRTGWTVTEIARRAGVYGDLAHRRRSQATTKLSNVVAMDRLHREIADVCVDCGGRSMPGGALRCLPCFQGAKAVAA